MLPRDIMTQKIREQMKKDDMPYVWMDMSVLGEEVIKNHFPHIYEKCLEEGDMTVQKNGFQLHQLSTILWVEFM